MERKDCSEVIDSMWKDTGAIVCRNIELVRSEIYDTLHRPVSQRYN